MTCKLESQYEDFAYANPLSRREAEALYNWIKQLDYWHGPYTSTNDIMDIIVQYYD